MTATRPEVALAGSLPPLAGISGYCGGLVAALGRRIPVEAVSFRAMYPAFLHPGGGRADPTVRMPPGGELEIRRDLAWYNPVGWVLSALRIRAGVVHIQHWSLPLVPVWLVFAAVSRLRRKRVIVTIHNVLPHEPSLLWGPASRLLCRMADLCIVHSETNFEAASEHLRLPRRKLRRIRMGVDPARHAGSQERKRARDRLGVPESARVALFFGAVRRYKGLDVLLKAFARVSAPDAMLLVAGRPWVDWEPYDKLIRSSPLAGRVRAWPEFVSREMADDLFAASDLAVLPYVRFEAQSAVGAEALSWGLPMVVTDVGGLPEYVPDRSLATPPGDEDALARAISCCLGDPGRLARLKELSAAHAALFSWDKVAEETIGVYREAAAGAGRGPMQ